jgi:hypothetical protein
VADAENLPFYILASVILAVLIAAVLGLHFRAQAEVRVDEQAQALADDISRTCFAALTRLQPTYSLPGDVGGSRYELMVEENTIIVKVVDGARSGRSYYSSVNAELVVQDNGFIPGGVVYVLRMNDQVIISAFPISLPPWEIKQPGTTTPPQFYTWANENVENRREEAVAIVAAYFFSLVHNPATKDNKVLDVLAYSRNRDLIEVRVGYRGADNIEFLQTVRTGGKQDNLQVGEVAGAWVIRKTESRKGDITDNLKYCPSVENAVATGWLYSPSQVLEHLRGRTWKLEDNTIVVVPEDASWTEAAAEVGGRTFCTYRFSFTHENISAVLFYRMLATAPEEPLPGFTFTSEPLLEPLT